jgi:hypothetical protein
MKDLPHARAHRRCRLGWAVAVSVAHFAWSDDRLFSVFSLVMVAHFA